MSRVLCRILPAVALCAGAIATMSCAWAADIAGRMTGDYLQQCVSDQAACRDYTNSVLQVLDAARSLGQGRNYKGCAPSPLSLEDTGKLIEWILNRPQQATGYAADDIAMAAQALWPCK